MTTERNIYQRFSDACATIDSQAWVLDLENKQYKSIPIDAMRAGVRKACIKAGLIHIGPYDIEFQHTAVDRTHRYIGSCRFAYINIDNPEERIEFESMGESMDNGDKGIGKFITNLIKNHYKSVFDIGEQSEDDVDSYSNKEFEQATRKEANKSKGAELVDAINGWIRLDLFKNGTHPTIRKYSDVYGKLEEWPDDVLLECYEKLKAEGHQLKEVKI